MITSTSSRALAQQQLAAALEVIARRLETGDLMVSPEAASALDPLDALIQTNAAIDMQRSRIMAGQG